MSVVDSATALGFALDSLVNEGDQFENADDFDRTDIRDSGALAEYKRGKIDEDYRGSRGLVNRVYGARGWVPGYQSQMNTLSDAQENASNAERQSGFDLNAKQAQSELLQLRNQMDSAAADQNKSDFQRQLDAVNASFHRQISQAEGIANNKTFSSQGFQSQAAANAFADHLKSDAENIHDHELDRFFAGRYSELQSGNEQINVLERLAARDQLGAARGELEHQLNSEERSIDPNDTQRIQQFEKIRSPALSNFDADAARQASSDLDSPHGGAGLPVNVADVLRKLDDAATRMDKILSQSKTLVLLRD
jgi:hypothetical protein